MVKIKNDSGEISITNDVLTYLAGDAATSCFGVKGMVACTKEGGPWQLQGGRPLAAAAPGIHVQGRRRPL